MSDTNHFHGYLRMLHKEWKPSVNSPNFNDVEYGFSYAVYQDELTGSRQIASQPTIHLYKDFTQIVGRNIRLNFSGKIRCIDCGKPTSKSFNQGSCYSCFSKLAKNDLCIMQPTKCHFHLGTCREPNWGEINCFQKHSIYLAISSGPKVGITKEKKIENRWIDQGAMAGLELCTTNSRIEAGIIESFIGQFLPDRTTWQKMVTGAPEIDSLDLLNEREKFLKAIQNSKLEFSNTKGKKSQIQFHPSKMKETSLFHYPIQSYPKAKSIKPVPNQSIESKLIGIKGQYLLMEEGVLNLRTYGGYGFQLEIL
jgi:hypothetical protein